MNIFGAVLKPGMNVHSIAKFLYGLVGVIFLLLGLAIVLVKTGVVPAGVQGAVMHATDNNVFGLHLLQEFGGMMVFAAILSFWCVKNYGQSMGYHWALTVFFGLLALVHWFDVRGVRSPMGPAINTLPVLLFAVIGVWRVKVDSINIQKA